MMTSFLGPELETLISKSGRKANAFGQGYLLTQGKALLRPRGCRRGFTGRATAGAAPVHGPSVYGRGSPGAGRAKAGPRETAHGNERLWAGGHVLSTCPEWAQHVRWERAVVCRKGLLIAMEGQFLQSWLQRRGEGGSPEPAGARKRWV